MHNSKLCWTCSSFASMLGIPIGITSSTIGLKICAIAAGVNSLIKRKKKKHNKIVLSAKSKNTMQVLISKTLIDSIISHDKFVLINNVQKEYGNLKT